MLWLLATIALLLLLAALYDLRAKRRGTYRTAAEWREITARRKTVRREVKKRRGSGADDDRGDT